MGAARVNDDISISSKDIQAAVQEEERAGRAFVAKLERLLGDHDNKRSCEHDKLKIVSRPKRTQATAQQSLDAKAAKKLATEVANVCLKQLSTVNGLSNDRNQGDEGNRSPLKTVSSNIVSTPHIPSTKGKTAAKDFNNGTPIYSRTRIAAECGCIAFRYFASTSRSFDTKICDGLMVLCGRLLSNEHFDLAREMLQELRHMLEANRAKATSASNDTVRHPLHVSGNNTADLDFLKRVIMYQSMVLKLTAAIPQDLGGLLAALRNEETGPEVVVSHWIELGGDKHKGASYLESLSANLLAVVPLNGQDHVSKHSSTTVGADVEILHLRTLALQYRRNWWSLAGHTADAEAVRRDFARALRSLNASSSDATHATGRYAAARECYNILQLDTTMSSSSVDFDIALAMWQLAHAAHHASAEGLWTASLREITQALPQNDAKHITAQLAGVFQSCYEDSAASAGDLPVLLRGKLLGSHRDVLSLLSLLLSLFTEREEEIRRSAADSLPCQLLLSALKVAQRLYRTSQDSAAPHLLRLIKAALRVPNLRKSLPRNIGAEVLELFVKRGTLSHVATLSSTNSAMDAWSSCGDAVIMLQLVKILAQKAVQSEPSVVQDTELLQSLQPGVRSALLQARVEKLLEMAAPAKHVKAVSQLLNAAIEELYTIWDASQNPLRRRMLNCWQTTARDALGLQADHIEHEDDPSLAISDLAEDRGLTRYQQDIHACYHVARFLQAPSRNGVFLEQAIQDWTTMLEDQDGTLYNPDMSIRLLELAIAYNDAILNLQESVRLLILKLRLQRRLCGTKWPIATLAHLAEYFPSEQDQSYTQHILDALRKELNQDGHGELAKLKAYVALADWHVGRSEVDACRALLEKAAAIGESLSASPAPRYDRLGLLVVCTKLWKVESILSLHDNDMARALTAAKNSLLAANSIWRLSGETGRLQVKENEPEDESREERGPVSKLQLASQKSSTSARGSQQLGALYWKGVRASCAALLHISDTYAHLGDFIDADAFSRQALAMALPLEQSDLLIAVRSHRAALLTRAGKQEEAAMMLAKNDMNNATKCPGQAAIKHFMAEALLAFQEDDCDGAMRAIRKAERCREQYDQSLRQILTILEEDVAAPSKPAAKPLKQSTKVRSSNEKPQADAQVVHISDPTSACMSYDFGILPSSSHAIAVLKQRIAQRTSPSQHPGAADLGHVAAMAFSTRSSQFDDAMSSLDDQLKQNLRLNALREMVIVQPNLSSEQSLQQPNSRRVAQRPTPKQRKRADGKPLISLKQAQSALQPDYHATGLASMAEIYGMSSRRVELLSYESVLDLESAARREDGLEQEHASSIAQFRHSTALRSRPKDAKPNLPWRLEQALVGSLPDFNDFKADHVDTLPDGWTATSLHLNEQGTKLFIARYRKDEVPLVASLPFGRADDELDVDAAFDYQSAKAELIDIIDRSNKSCHASTGVRKTKSDWWREREDLDRQLGALLSRIGSEWIGGFSGLLATYKMPSSRLGQIREILENLVNQYWTENKIVVSDAIVELFANVSNSSADEESHEPAVLDLLCFLNDHLRVKGVDLLNDEEDFDSMAVKLAETLSHLSELDIQTSVQEHLVLILDKRLQMFPWESLPCLSGVSVSRLGSMSMLREQILAMRKQCSFDSCGSAAIARSSGAAIVNPASDLAQTEAVLQPVLSHLVEQGPGWSTRIRHIPTEEEFGQALSSSSIFMYFGHGSGAQYIRPQAVRRLKSCSQVVWLMGCSSGDVREHGEYEPSSMPYSYLLASTSDQTETSVPSTKCLGVVANLWDVTDKDIDRFSIEMGRRWGLWPDDEASQPAKAARRAEPIQVPVTPKRPAKTSQTPGPRKATRSDNDARALSSLEVAEPVALGKAVAQSRDVCFLRYLNGAAPVLYGIPVGLAI